MALSLKYLRRRLTVLNAELAALKQDLADLDIPPGVGGTLYIKEFDSALRFDDQAQRALNDTYVPEAGELGFDNVACVVFNNEQNVTTPSSSIGFGALVGAEIEEEE